MKSVAAVEEFVEIQKPCIMGCIGKCVKNSVVQALLIVVPVSAAGESERVIHGFEAGHFPKEGSIDDALLFMSECIEDRVGVFVEAEVSVECKEAVVFFECFYGYFVAGIEIFCCRCCGVPASRPVIDGCTADEMGVQGGLKFGECRVRQGYGDYGDGMTADEKFVEVCKICFAVRNGSETGKPVVITMFRVGAYRFADFFFGLSEFGEAEEEGGVNEADSFRANG